jgi:hypothetical protein
VHLDVVRYGRQIAGVAVPASDLKGHQGHLPRPLRRTQRLVDASDLQHEDPVGAQLDCMAQRNAVDQAAIQIVPAVDDRRRQYPWHRG